MFDRDFFVSEFLAWSEYTLGNLHDAIHYTKLVLEENPAQESAAANLQLFTQQFAVKLNQTTDKRIKKKTKGFSKDQEWYHTLCRGKSKIKKSISDKLYCKYGQYDPIFLLKPLKIEYAYDDPNITLFHDLLSEHQMNHLKTKAKPYLSRATVHDLKGKLVFANYRISKSTWMKPENDRLIKRLYNTVGRVVNLDTQTFEPMQIANYGLAGQYGAHVDYLRDKKNPRYRHYGGNRLATMLFYLSDVEKGGSTVFTNTGPGATISPRKGTGVFWYNLKRNGSGNIKTEHAGCPVVLGSKWISNIWIHEYYQEFRFPCSLNKDE